MSVLLCGWDDGNPYSQSSAILHRFAGWAAAMIPRVGKPERFGACTCIAVCRAANLADDPLAVVIYHNMDAPSRCLEISMAASTPRWATRGTIRACLSYPFQQIGCGVVVCRVPRRERRTKRFLSGIGFRNTGLIPDGFGDDDCSIYCMTKTQAARWLPPSAQQKEAA
jgi:hypothetical protein